MVDTGAVHNTESLWVPRVPLEKRATPRERDINSALGKLTNGLSGLVAGGLYCAVLIEAHNSVRSPKKKIESPLDPTYACPARGSSEGKKTASSTTGIGLQSCWTQADCDTGTTVKKQMYHGRYKRTQSEEQAYRHMKLCGFKPEPGHDRAATMRPKPTITRLRL